MLQILFATILFTLTVSEEAPKYIDCNSPLGHTVGITLSGAEVENGRYILKKGTNITGSGDFITNQEVKRAKVVGKGFTNTRGMRLQLTNSDVCKFLKCPLQKNVQYHSENSATVDLILFTANITLQLEVIDADRNETIACAQFPATLSK